MFHLLVPLMGALVFGGPGPYQLASQRLRASSCMAIETKPPGEEEGVIAQDRDGFARDLKAKATALRREAAAAAAWDLAWRRATGVTSAAVKDASSALNHEVQERSKVAVDNLAQGLVQAPTRAQTSLHASADTMLEGVREAAATAPRRLHALLRASASAAVEQMSSGLHSGLLPQPEERTGADLRAKQEDLAALKAQLAELRRNRPPNMEPWRADDGCV